MDLYKASTRPPPKTQEEFIEKIIKGTPSTTYVAGRRALRLRPETRRANGRKTRRPLTIPRNLLFWAHFNSTTMRLHHTIFFVLSSFVVSAARPAT